MEVMQSTIFNTYGTSVPLISFKVVFLLVICDLICGVLFPSLLSVPEILLNTNKTFYLVSNS